jgi:hypothetical protein
VATKIVHMGFVVRDRDGSVVVILTGGDAAEAADWYSEEGFEVVAVDLADPLAAV